MEIGIIGCIFIVIFISLWLYIWLSLLDSNKQALELFSLICYNELRRKVGGSKKVYFKLLMVCMCYLD